ncbi:MAG: hypothetical protein HQM11_18090 [SAR324 cluster bacterium]|nr:hypothetical protein [SAR324 cluster bacterium]
MKKQIILLIFFLSISGLQIVWASGNLCIIWKQGMECPPDQNEEETTQIQGLTESKNDSLQDFYDFISENTSSSDFDMSDSGFDTDTGLDDNTVMTDTADQGVSMDREVEDDPTMDTTDQGTVDSGTESTEEPGIEEGGSETPTPATGSQTTNAPPPEETKSSEEKKSEKVEGDEKKEEKKEEKEGKKEEKKEKKEEKKDKKPAGFKPKQASVGMNGAFSGNIQAYSIPFGYNLSPVFKIAGSLPYIKTSDFEGTGNLNLSGKYFLAFDDSLALVTSLGVKLPTGDEKTGSRDVIEWAFGQNTSFTMDKARILASYVLNYRPADSNMLDKGDSFNFFAGMDVPANWLMQFTNLYVAVLSSYTTEDLYDGTGLGNQRTLLDITTGIVFLSWNLRVGITIPTYTQSETLSNSDRNPVVDFGLRYTM